LPVLQPPALGTTLPAAQPSFFTTMLAPRLDARLRGETAAALEFTNRFANPWTRDNETVDRMERHAIRASKSAVKRYLVEKMGLDAWSLPVRGGRGGGGLDSMRTASGGTRLRFGWSHRAPRAELLIPANRGRVSFGVDGRGGVTASFETFSSRLRVGGAYDPEERDFTFALVGRF
jgi:hypothetical protein